MSARLTCSDNLKEIIYRCIGERRKRYESADELIEALRHRPKALKAGVLRSLERRSPRVHRNSDQTAKRSHQSRETRRRGRAWWSLRANDCGRSGKTEPVAGRRAGWWSEAHGDQAAARKGSSHHAARREAVLAAGYNTPMISGSGGAACAASWIPRLPFARIEFRGYGGRAGCAPRGFDPSRRRSLPARARP